MRKLRELFSRVSIRVEQIWTHEAHQTVEAEVLPTVGGAGEEQERIDLPPLLELCHETVGQRRPRALVDTQMVRLVDDHKVPWIGFEQSPASASPVVLGAAQRVEGRHHHRCRRPEIAARRVRLSGVALHADVEHVLQAELPLWHQLRWREDEQPSHAPGGDKGHQHQATFDGLPEPHVIGHQPAERPFAVHGAADPQLVREQLDPGPRENSPLLIDGRDGERLGVDQCVGRVVERPVAEGRVQRRGLRDLAGRHLLQLSVEPHDDRPAHVRHDPTRPAPWRGWVTGVPGISCWSVVAIPCSSIGKPEIERHSALSTGISKPAAARHPPSVSRYRARVMTCNGRSKSPWKRARSAPTCSATKS